ncbi:MAG: alpha/beta hydrolase-fold protein [Saprospiraceae bacterium]|nr:alpha/beta hydrolase-fold protein [Saprospiraceae bacterium]
MINTIQRLLSGITFLFLCGNMFAQQDDILTQTDSIYSDILNQKITLTVCLPKAYQDAPKKRYKALYYLYENPKSVEIITALSQKTQQGKSALLVIGIDNHGKTDRLNNPLANNLLLSCLEKELIPAMEKKYRTNGQRILHDLSATGSFTLYAFLNRPELFNGYIAASKQWYAKTNDDFTVLADNVLSYPDAFSGRKIFLATLHNTEHHMNGSEVDKEMQAFATLLETRSAGQIAAKYQAFDDWGVPLHPGFEAGLKFVVQKKSSGKSPKTPLTMIQTETGRWIIQTPKKQPLYEVFIFDNGPDYPSEGLIRVVKNGKIGYADANTYEIVIAPQFDCAFPFENGKAKVSNQCQTVKEGEYHSWKSDTWLFVDRQGNIQK